MNTYGVSTMGFNYYFSYQHTRVAGSMSMIKMLFVSSREKKLFNILSISFVGHVVVQFRPRARPGWPDVCVCEQDTRTCNTIRVNRVCAFGWLHTHGCTQPPIYRLQENRGQTCTRCMPTRSLFGAQSNYKIGPHSLQRMRKCAADMSNKHWFCVLCYMKWAFFVYYNVAHNLNIKNWAKLPL